MSGYRPALPDPPPQTLAALRDWMVAEGANFQGYALDGRAIAEGFAVRHDGQAWLWGYEERGHWREEGRFATEAALVAHVVAHVAADQWAWSHPVLITPDRQAARAAEAACLGKGLAVKADSIPFGGPDARHYRVFVFGRDAEQARALARPPLHGR
ncbi:hypothetical protein [Vannielia litorea]|uniref:hypothetical protein n=1 Tax=Vannielia litorea TaxID=1217970 RepID=UPI001BD0D085|nr:hypothetical protein [Vannielia litorea]MBS8227035.1 hypothetical protein [Vannielia litorea]